MEKTGSIEERIIRIEQKYEEIMKNLDKMEEEIYHAIHILSEDIR